MASGGAGQVLRVHLRREQPDVRGAGGAGGGVHVDGQVQRGREGGHRRQRGAQERPHGEMVRIMGCAVPTYRNLLKNRIKNSLSTYI